MSPETKEFIAAFEQVFDTDWEHTKEMLGMRSETPEQKEASAVAGLTSIPIISDDGTFTNPKIRNETENWGQSREVIRRLQKVKADPIRLPLKKL